MQLQAERREGAEPGRAEHAERSEGVWQAEQAEQAERMEGAERSGAERSVASGEGGVRLRQKEEKGEKTMEDKQQE